MKLPFLKRRNDLGGAGPGVVIHVSNNGGRMDSSKDEDMELMQHVCDEFMQAIERKDKAMLMEALRALVLYIQDEDKEQDEGEGEDQDEDEPQDGEMSS